MASTSSTSSSTSSAVTQPEPLKVFLHHRMKAIISKEWWDFVVNVNSMNSDHASLLYSIANLCPTFQNFLRTRDKELAYILQKRPHIKPRIFSGTEKLNILSILPPPVEIPPRQTKSCAAELDQILRDLYPDERPIIKRKPRTYGPIPKHKKNQLKVAKAEKGAKEVPDDCTKDGILQNRLTEADSTNSERINYSDSCSATSPHSYTSFHGGKNAENEVEYTVSNYGVNNNKLSLVKKRGKKLMKKIVKRKVLLFVDSKDNTRTKFRLASETRDLTKDMIRKYRIKRCSVVVKKLTEEEIRAATSRVKSMPVVFGSEDCSTLKKNTVPSISLKFNHITNSVSIVKLGACVPQSDQPITIPNSSSNMGISSKEMSKESKPPDETETTTPSPTFQGAHETPIPLVTPIRSNNLSSSGAKTSENSEPLDKDSKLEWQLKTTIPNDVSSSGISQEDYYKPNVGNPEHISSKWVSSKREASILAPLKQSIEPPLKCIKLQNAVQVKIENMSSSQLANGSNNSMDRDDSRSPNRSRSNSPIDHRCVTPKLYESQNINIKLEVAQSGISTSSEEDSFEEGSPISEVNNSNEKYLSDSLETESNSCVARNESDHHSGCGASGASNNQNALSERKESDKQSMSAASAESSLSAGKPRTFQKENVISGEKFKTRELPSELRTEYCHGGIVPLGRKSLEKPILDKVKQHPLSLREKKLKDPTPETNGVVSPLKEKNFLKITPSLLLDDNTAGVQSIGVEPIHGSKIDNTVDKHDRAHNSEDNVSGDVMNMSESSGSPVNGPHDDDTEKLVIHETSTTGPSSAVASAKNALPSASQAESATKQCSEPANSQDDVIIVENKVEIIEIDSDDELHTNPYHETPQGTPKTNGPIPKHKKNQLQVASGPDNCTKDGILLNLVTEADSTTSERFPHNSTQRKTNGANLKYENTESDEPPPKHPKTSDEVCKLCKTTFHSQYDYSQHFVNNVPKCTPNLEASWDSVLRH